MNLVDRVKRLLLQPKEEWQVIDKESVDVADLYKFYIAPLAAIGPICSLIGTAVVGTSLIGMGTLRVSFSAALVQSVLVFGLMLGGVYVVALIIDALAPTFGAQRNLLQAFKLTAYAFTAAWVAGLGQVVPLIGVLIPLVGGIVDALDGPPPTTLLRLESLKKCAWRIRALPLPGAFLHADFQTRREHLPARWSGARNLRPVPDVRPASVGGACH